MSETNLFDAFSVVCQKNPSKEAILFPKDKQFQSLSYGELYTRCIQWGQHLKKKGIQPADKVVIFLENRIEYPILFWAILSVEAVVVFIDAQYSQAQVKNLLAHSGAKAIILSDTVLSKFQDQKFDVEVINVDSKSTLQGFSSYPNTPPAMSQTKEPLAALFYTSGTTQASKAVMLSHQNLLANVRSLLQLDMLRPEDRVISFLPLHHTYSFTGTLLLPLLGGATIAYPSGLASADLLHCLKEAKVTIFVGVPQVFSLIYKSVSEKMKNMPGAKRAIVGALTDVGHSVRQLTNINLNKKILKQMHENLGPHLRFMVSGGAKLDKEVASSFVKWGFTILEGYGLTETAPVSAFNPLNAPKIGSVGKALPNVEIKIVDANEKGIGEVAIKGPNVMMGYFKMQAETDQVIKDGWFYSGDLGYIDREGYVFLVGRKKEMIVLSNGKNIYPEEIELLYGKNRLIKEMAVLPIKQASLSGVEQLGAVIVINEDEFKKEKISNIRERLKWEFDNVSAQLPSYQTIKGFVVSQDPLPRTRLGKVMRYRLEEIYTHLQEPVKKEATDEKTVSSEFAAFPDALKKAVVYLQESLKKPIHLKDHLELDLGLDSLGRVEILLSLQEYLQLDISEEQAADFFMCNTIEDLLNKVKMSLPDHLKQSTQKSSINWGEILKEQPSAETRGRIKLKFGFLSLLFNLIVISFFKIVFKMFFLLKVEGRDNLKKKDFYLICPNHVTYLDGIFILCALPLSTCLKTYFVGSSVFFDHPALKPFSRVGRLLSLEMSLNLVEALKACSYVLDHKKNVCYFPEGQRSINGELNEFKKGLGILMYERHVPVVPVFLKGAHEAWPRYKKWPKIHRVTVIFGAPIDPQKVDMPSADKDQIYAHLAATVQEAVSSLKVHHIFALCLFAQHCLYL